MSLVQSPRSSTRRWLPTTAGSPSTTASAPRPATDWNLNEDSTAIPDPLRPYRGPLAIVVFLQLLQTLAALYLPTLNADIVDYGVVPGDTDYIMRLGGLSIGLWAAFRSS